MSDKSDHRKEQNDDTHKYHGFLPHLNCLLHNFFKLFIKTLSLMPLAFESQFLSYYIFFLLWDFIRQTTWIIQYFFQIRKKNKNTEFGILLNFYMNSMFKLNKLYFFFVKLFHFDDIILYSLQKNGISFLSMLWFIYTISCLSTQKIIQNKVTDKEKIDLYLEKVKSTSLL